MNRGLWIWSFPLARLFCFPPISCTVLMITTAIARAIVRAWHYLPEELNPERFLKGVYEDRHVACKH